MRTSSDRPGHSQGLRAVHLQPVPMGPQRTAHDDDRGPKRPIIVLHELFGLTDHVVDVCHRLAEAGHEVVAPDLYGHLAGRAERGGSSSRPLDGGARAMVLPETEEGRTLGFVALAGLTMPEVTRRVEQAIHAVRTTPAAPRCGSLPAVGLLGLSVGGHLAYRLPAHLPIDRAVLFYPGWLDGTDNPLGDGERPLDRPPAPDTLVVVGAEDRLLPEASRRAISTTLAAAGSQHRLLTLPGAGHGFLAPHRSTHHALAERAWADTVAWLDA